MDFEFSPEQLAFVEEVERFLDEHDDPEVFDVTRENMAQIVDTPKRRAFMAQDRRPGLAGDHLAQGVRRPGGRRRLRVPAERGAGPRGGPQIGKGVGIVGKTIIRHGTEKLKAEFLPKILRNEVEFAVGYSEPNAGSDAASMQLKATKRRRRLAAQRPEDVDDVGPLRRVVLGGGPDRPRGAQARRHHAVPRPPRPARASPIKPIWTMGDERTNEVYLDDVLVPDDYVVGELNHGFQYISEALDLERFTMFTFSPIAQRLELLCDYVAHGQRDGVPLRDDPVDPPAHRPARHPGRGGPGARPALRRRVVQGRGGARRRRRRSTSSTPPSSPSAWPTPRWTSPGPGTQLRVKTERRPHGGPGRVDLPLHRDRHHRRRGLGDPEEHHRPPQARAPQELLIGRRTHRLVPGPLAGVTVLDLSSVGPAARCTRLLADYGAEVVKVGPGARPGAGPLVDAAVLRLQRASGACAACSSTCKSRRGPRRLPGPGRRGRRGGRELPARRRRPARHRLRGVRGREPRPSSTARPRGYGQDGPRVGLGRPRPRLPGRRRLTWPPPARAADGGPPIPGATIADAAAGGMHAALAISAALVGRRRAPARAPTSTCRWPTGSCGSCPWPSTSTWPPGPSPGPGHDVLTGRYACYDTYRAGRRPVAGGGGHRGQVLRQPLPGARLRAVDRPPVRRRRPGRDPRRPSGPPSPRRDRDDWVAELGRADTCVAPGAGRGRDRRRPRSSPARRAWSRPSTRPTGPSARWGPSWPGMAPSTEPVVPSPTRRHRHRRAARARPASSGPARPSCEPTGGGGMSTGERAGHGTASRATGGGAEPHRRPAVRGDRRVPRRARLHLDDLRVGGERQPAVLGRRRGRRRSPAGRSPRPRCCRCGSGPTTGPRGAPRPHLPLQVHFDLKELFGLPEAVMTDNTIVFYEPVRPGDASAPASPALGQRREDDQARHRPLLGHRRRVHQPATATLVGVESYTGFGYRRSRRRRGGVARARSTPSRPCSARRGGRGRPPPRPRLRRHRHHRRPRRPGQPGLAAHAPRQGLRRRAQRHPGHLPEHAQPGGLVRALPHRLDRSPRPPGPHDLPHARLGVPRRHHGPRPAR